MTRATLLPMAAAVVLSLLGWPTLARPGGATGVTTITTSPADAATHTKDLAAVLRQEEDRPTPWEGALEALAPDAASAPGWLDGSFSNTYFYNFVTGTTMMLTTETVGYWGTEDLSYPTVGDLYYGRVVIGVVGTISTPVMANILLPPHTDFAIDPDDPDRRVRCFLENVQTGSSAELTGADCPERPGQGLYGAQFAPEAGYWELSPGEVVAVVFPLVSTTELKGIAATPADCLIGSVWAAASLDLWDAPGPADRCPLPKDHGTWQGVFVPFDPPEVS